MESNTGRRSVARRYLTAFLAPAVITGVMQLTWPLFEPNPVSLYFLAVKTQPLPLQRKHCKRDAQLRDALSMEEPGATESSLPVVSSRGAGRRGEYSFGVVRINFLD